MSLSRSKRATIHTMYILGEPTKDIAKHLGVADSHLRSQISEWRLEDPDAWPYRRVPGVFAQSRARVTVDFPPAERERLISMAQAAGTTVSAYIRGRLRSAEGV